MSIFCLFCIFVIYFSIFFFTVLSHFCKSFFSFFHFLFFITQYGFFPFIMVIWLQRGVICMKTFFKNLTFTFLCLGISTILAFFFFNLVLHPVSNKSLHYQRCVWCFSQYNRRHCQTFHNGRSASKKLLPMSNIPNTLACYTYCITFVILPFWLFGIPHLHKDVDDTGSPLLT